LECVGRAYCSGVQVFPQLSHCLMTSFSDEMATAARSAIASALGDWPEEAGLGSEPYVKAENAIRMALPVGTEPPEAMVHQVCSSHKVAFDYEVSALVVELALSLRTAGPDAPSLRAKDMPAAVDAHLALQLKIVLRKLGDKLVATARRMVEVRQQVQEDIRRRAEFEAKTEKALGSVDVELLQEALLPRGHALELRIKAAVDVSKWAERVKDALSGPLAETVFADLPPLNPMCGSWAEYCDGADLLMGQLCRGLEGETPALFAFVKATADVDRRARLRMAHRAARSFVDFFELAKTALVAPSFGLAAVANPVAAGVVIPRVGMAARLAAVQALLDEARGEGTRQQLMGVTTDAPAPAAGAAGALPARIDAAWFTARLGEITSGSADSAATWNRAFRGRLRAVCETWSTEAVRGAEWAGMAASWGAQLSAQRKKSPKDPKDPKRVLKGHCKHCNQKGHTAPKCPSAKCHKCGEMGHMKSQCPSLAGGASSRKDASS